MRCYGFIAARCPCCLVEGAILIENVPNAGDFGACLQCGAVVYFASATGIGAGGVLETKLALVDGRAALARSSKSESLRVVALLDRAVALIHPTGQQRGQA